MATASNSPFTTALLNNLTTPGVDLRIAFGRVRDEVLQQHQQPSGALTSTARSAETPWRWCRRRRRRSDADAKARQEYEFAAQIGTKQAWDSFLAVHASGIYADFALRAQKAKLQGRRAGQRGRPMRHGGSAEEQATTQVRGFPQAARRAGAPRQTEEVKKRLTEQAKRELDEERRKVAESSQREVDEARKQAAEAKRQADEARRQVEEAKRQAVEDAQASGRSRREEGATGSSRSRWRRAARTTG